MSTLPAAPVDRVPVMVLNWNGWPDTFDCLRSLRRAEDVSEVWLIDNGSREQRSAEAAAIYPGLRLMPLGANYGYAGGYNRALRLAAAEGVEFAYLLNNDATVEPGFLARVVDMARGDGRLAAVGSRVEPVGHDGAGRRSGAVATTPVGAGLLLRLSSCESHGYFDERFFCYSEEIEWCMRVADAGRTVAVCDDSVVYHKGSGSNVAEDATYYVVRNRFLLARLRWKPHSTGPRPDPEHFAAVTAEDARRNRNWERWRAVASAIDDARAERYGIRTTSHPRFSAALRLAAWSIHARSVDWLRRRRSLAGHAHE